LTIHQDKAVVEAAAADEAKRIKNKKSRGILASPSAAYMLSCFAWKPSNIHTLQAARKAAQEAAQADTRVSEGESGTAEK